MAEDKPAANRVEKARCPHGFIGTPHVHEEYSKQYGGAWLIDYFDCALCIERCNGFPNIAYRIGLPGEMPPASQTPQSGIKSPTP